MGSRPLKVVVSELPEIHNPARAQAKNAMVNEKLNIGSNGLRIWKLRYSKIAAGGIARLKPVRMARLIGRRMLGDRLNRMSAKTNKPIRKAAVPIRMGSYGLPFDLTSLEGGTRKLYTPAKSLLPHK